MTFGDSLLAPSFVPAQTKRKGKDATAAGHRLMATPLPPTDARACAIVITRVCIRPGNNTDILEALGLIPAAVKS